jgi:hypothetical protein
LKTKANLKKAIPVVEKVKMKKKIILSQQKGREDTVDSCNGWQTEDDEKE